MADYILGAMTFGRMEIGRTTISVMLWLESCTLCHSKLTVSIKTFNRKVPSITTFILISVVLLNTVQLNVNLLYVVLMNVILLNEVLLSVILLGAVLLSVILSEAILMNVTLLLAACLLSFNWMPFW